MCAIGADFKHFRASKTQDFGNLRNVSSIMQAKVLSIMQGVCAPVTAP
jgi:hypothetical protein